MHVLAGCCGIGVFSEPLFLRLRKAQQDHPRTRRSLACVAQKGSRGGRHHRGAAVLYIPCSILAFAGRGGHEGTSCGRVLAAHLALLAQRTEATSQHSVCDLQGGLRPPMT